MIIKYLFSSPEGDISLGPEDLKRPFLITPSKSHASLTLGDYFEALKAFVWGDGGERLFRVLGGSAPEVEELDHIQEIWIRSEKHGVFYHVASVEILFGDRTFKFAVSTAVTEEAKARLTNEYEILKFLDRSLRLPYLPKVYEKGDVPCQEGHNHHETLTLMLSEWFQGYHEWHLSIDEKDHCQKVCIWDFENGHRYASEEEVLEIFRQASEILTLYYDARSFKQIYPWHHAAGDFVVKTGASGTHVKLTTVRNYQSIMDFLSKDRVNPMTALVYFFLNLTLKMRLDRLDGVGETAWAGDFAVGAATTGFFEGLSAMKKAGRFPHKTVNEVLTLFQSFSEQEFERVFRSLFVLYQDDDPADLSLLHTNLKNHITALSQALRTIYP
ncbi:MAG: hypothetical protein JRL30_05005 [Deltaproteobacteria bacterium]|nr:hypothetical protein [Deltaproteobacteria bacterium]